VIEGPQRIRCGASLFNPRPLFGLVLAWSRSSEGQAALKPVQPEDLAARPDTVVRKQHSAADFMASSPNA
jgi:hypothetical protein